MPTVFTHGLVGAVLSQVAPRGPTRWKVPLALAAVAVVPDLDVVAFSFGIPYTHPLGHRGFSHSLPFALLLAVVVCLTLFREVPRFGTRWWGLLGLAFVAAASHGLLDAATDAGLGIGLLIPFSKERFFYAFRPIRTAAVNPFQFFNTSSLGILACEARWIWLPLALASALVQAGRWLGYRRGSTR